MKTIRTLICSFLVCLLLNGNAIANPISINHISLTNPNYEDFLKDGFKPRNDVNAWPIQLPLDWDTDPFNDRNWRFQLHSWVLIDPYLHAYNRSKDPLILQNAIDIITDWYDFHVDRKLTSGMQWYDMSIGQRAMKLAWIWGEIDDGVTEVNDEQQEKIEHLVTLHINKLLDEELLSKGNHGYFQLVGLKLLCLHTKFAPQCTTEEKFNTNKMQELINRQFTTQGVHRENATYYHYYTLNTIRRLNIEELFGNEILSIIERAKQVTPWLVYPDNTFARVGDTNNSLEPKNKITMKPRSVNNTQVLIGDFIDSGYFTIRSPLEVDPNNATQLFVTGTSNLEYGGHKHADELSFELFHKGKLVFLDSGKYSYNRDKNREYILSAQAHNTLSLENFPISKRDVDGSGSKLKNYTVNKNSIDLNGEVLRPGLFHQKRKIQFYPYDTLFIKDEFTNKISLTELLKQFRIHTIFTSNLHVNPNLTIDKISDRKILIDGFATVELKTKKCELNIVQGQEQPMLGWVSFAYNEIEPTNVIQAKCPVLRKGEVRWSINLM